MNGQTKAGFSKTEGQIRKLTIVEQLTRVVNMNIDEIDHPIHGRINVGKDVASYLLRYEEEHLYRFKLSIFNKQEVLKNDSYLVNNKHLILWLESFVDIWSRAYVSSNDDDSHQNNMQNALYSFCDEHKLEYMSADELINQLKNRNHE